MSDDPYIQCPDRGCTLRLQPDELRAHLEWDHNYTAGMADETVKRLLYEMEQS